MAEGISALDLPTVVLSMDPDESGRRPSYSMAAAEADRLIGPIRVHSRFCACLPARAVVCRFS